MTPSEINPIRSINTGFLSGNLFSGWSQEEIDQLDAPASIRKFASLWEEAIRAEYPHVEHVSVEWQDAEGILPAALRTCILRENDEEDWRIEESVELLSSSIYESQAWQVYRNV